MNDAERPDNANWSDMTDVELMKVVQEFIAPYVTNEVGDIAAESTFADLGVDSLAAVSLVADLEEKFSISIPNEVTLGIRTVGQVVESLRKALTER